MKQPEEQNFTPIKLELARMETVHVTTGNQKVASLCIVLKDSPAVGQLIEHPSPVSKMIISDVIPLKDDPQKAEVIFRNLTPQEVIDASRNFALPPGALMEIFSDVLNDLGLASRSYDDDDLDADAIDESDEEYVDDISEDDSDNVEVIDLSSLMQGAVIPLPAEDKTLYSITMSLAEAHLGQMICVGTNAPAFVLTSEKVMAENSDHETVWEDFIALLEFPYLDTAEYFDSTASLIQAVTGSYPLNLDSAQVDVLRATLLNDILRLSEGSQKALIEAFGLINPMKKVYNKTKDKVSEKPTSEEVSLFFLQNAIDKMYQRTSPHIVAGLIQETPNMAEYVEDIDTVNEIFKNSGLEELFDNVLESTKTDEISFLTKPTASATKEELISYYSAPITPYSFPESMRSFVPKIQMPLLYDNAWASHDPEVKETESNAGEITVAKLITIAVRFSRLKAIAESSIPNFHPIGFLVQNVNFPGENAIWAFIESVILLGRPTEGDLFFTELMASLLPQPHDGEVAPEELMQTIISSLIHRLGHTILEEEWNKEAFVVSLKDQPLIKGFIEDFYSSIEKMEDDEQEHPCPVQLATYSLFSIHPNYVDLVKELAYSLRLLAELNALKHTDYTDGSAEWNNYIALYLREMFEMNGGGSH